MPWHMEACQPRSILDLSSRNIMTSSKSATTAASAVEQAELGSPSPRKVLADRTIHLSYDMQRVLGPVVIIDLGDARLGEPGQKQSGDAMPGVYRAPETIADMEWDSKIDIWSFGVMVRITAPQDSFHFSLLAYLQIWSLFEEANLFSAFKDGNLDDELHFAEMVSLIGTPPKQFLERSDRCCRYWDSEGEDPLS